MPDIKRDSPDAFLLTYIDAMQRHLDRCRDELTEEGGRGYRAAEDCMRCMISLCLYVERKLKDREQSVRDKCGGER